MKTKSIMFLVAIALVLVGCNKEKEENIDTSAISAEALPNASNNVVPTTNVAPPTPAHEQGNVVGVTGQQVTPQAPQEVVVMPPQTMPIVDSQNQIQPMPVVPISGQQSVDNVSTVQAPAVATVSTATPAGGNTVTSTATPSPVAQGGVVSGPATPATPGTGGLVTASEPTPAQNVPYGALKEKSGMPQQQGVVGNSQLAAPTPGASTGTTGVVGQTTDVAGTKASFRKISPAKDDGSGANSGTKPSSEATPNTPDDTDD
ncbi:conserved hypothetical protein [Gammaproteobacteria bacterium]